MTELVHRPEAIGLAILIAVVYPLIGLYRFRRIEHLPEPLPSKTRLRLYGNLVLSQWMLVGLTALFFFDHGRSLADLGQTVGPSLLRTVSMSVAVLAVFGLLSVFTTRELRRATPLDFPARLRRTGKILPQSSRERIAFVAVAITAGVCEEILYRGYVPWFVATWTGAGPIAGYVVAAIVFGLGHAYQGRDGMIVTGVLGLFFGGLAFLAQSLVPGQLLHVALDLVNGIAVGASLERARVAAEAELPPADVDAPAAPSP